MSILDFKKPKVKKEPPKEPVPDLRCELVIELTTGRTVSYSKPYMPAKTLDEHWGSFMPWFRAEVCAKTFTMSYVNGDLIGERTFTHGAIEGVDIRTR